MSDSERDAKRDGGGSQSAACMRLDIRREVRRIAGDPRITDYDLWRTERNINAELFGYESRREPIPFDLVRWRAVVRRARQRRGRS